MSTTGLNLRASSGFVGDGTGETYCLATDYYPTVRGGLTFGLSGINTGQIDARDRNTGGDRRLAGFCFPHNSYDMNVQIDLPDGSGTYDIGAAFGESDFATPNMEAVFYDNTTSLISISHGAGMAADHYYDASDRLATSNADWASNHVNVSKVFASSTFKVKVNPSLGSYVTLAHLYFLRTGAGGGGGSGLPPIPQYFNSRPIATLIRM